MLIHFPLTPIAKHITPKSAEQEYYLAKVEYNNALQRSVTDAEFFYHARERLDLATQVFAKIGGRVCTPLRSY